MESNKLTEKAILSMDCLNITQGMNGDFSHKGCYAIDIAGNNSGIESLRAPFTGIIKRISKGTNTVWIESNEKVRYADGTLDYMTVLTIHDNNVSDLYVGKVIKQGIIYYQEGTKGHATGNHIHISAGKGKYEGNGWYENAYGKWCVNNQYPINKALFLSDKMKIVNDYDYVWVRATEDMDNKFEEAIFDYKFYSDRYSDLKKAFGYDKHKLFIHWENYGMKEGRMPSATFDPKYYLNTYSDLKKAFGSDYKSTYNHFRNYGLKESRKSSPVFDIKYYRGSKHNPSKFPILH